MLMPSQCLRILVATKLVDFRKEHDGRDPLAQSMLAEDPFTGTVFARQDAEAQPCTPSLRAAGRNRGHLPASLPRFERLIEPDSLLCPCGCGEMHRIGEDRTKRLDIVPARLRVIVTVHPKYACRRCADGVTQAPAPAHLIEGGLPTKGALAHVLVSKYADYLPLYRQSQILVRRGRTASQHAGRVSPP